MADETEKTQKVDAAMEEASSNPEDEQKPAAIDLGAAKETATSKPDSPTAAAAAAASTSVKCTKCGKKWARKG